MEKNNDIQHFFDMCDAFMRSSFIMAKPRLVDLLKSITASDVLTEAFTTVVSGFDYAKAKSRCLITIGVKDKPIKRLVLPQDPSQMIAFVFLLLCDFEKDIASFNRFIFTYFDRDGNYAESFNAFCAEVIAPFKGVIYEAFYGVDKEETAEEKREEVPAPEKIEKTVNVEEEEKAEEAAPEEKKAERPEAEAVAEEKKTEEAPEEEVEEVPEADEKKTEPTKEEAPSPAPPVYREETGERQNKERPAYSRSDGVNAAAYALLSSSGKRRSGFSFSRKIKKLSEGVSPLFLAEKTELATVPLPAETKSVGVFLLAEAESRLSDGDIDGLKIALCGYNYYLEYNMYESDNIRSVVAMIEDFEKSDK